jgi:hypothetical protein
MRRILFSAVVIFFAWLSVVFASQIGMIPFSEKISNSKDIIAAKVEKISRTIGPWLQPEHQVLCTVLKTFKGDLKPGEQVKWRFIPGFESGEPSELRPGDTIFILFRCTKYDYLSHMAVTGLNDPILSKIEWYVNFETLVDPAEKIISVCGMAIDDIENNKITPFSLLDLLKPSLSETAIDDPRVKTALKAVFKAALSQQQGRYSQVISLLHAVYKEQILVYIAEQVANESDKVQYGAIAGSADEVRGDNAAFITAVKEIKSAPCLRAVIDRFLPERMVQRKNGVLDWRAYPEVVPAALPVVIRYAHELPETSDRINYIKMLEHYAVGKEAITQIVSVLGDFLKNDPDVHIRCTSAFTLGRIGDPGATPVLLSVVEKDEYLEVITDAAMALGEIRDPSALPSLRKFVDEFETRKAASKDTTKFYNKESARTAALEAINRTNAGN